MDGQTATSLLLERYPEYSTTTKLDDLRATEYSYLDEQHHVYLDYTGAGLAASSQHNAHRDRFMHATFGNPHSSNPTSQAATDLVEHARARILRHFNASPDEYTIVFTPNATGAARLVGESYPWRRSSRLVLTADNHNSLNGLRQFAESSHANTAYVPIYDSENVRIREEDVIAALSRSTVYSPRTWLEKKKKQQKGRDGTRTGGGRRGLFAYPAQSNFTGVRHPLSWVRLAQSRGYDVLLDAAAYLPTSTLDLSELRPEFVMVSWYKLFGVPTGVGCLIARRDALSRLNRPWFAGGTVQAATVGLNWHLMEKDEAAFEDGTINYLSIPDVTVGLEWLSSIGIETIATRVRCLTGWAIERLLTLTHSHGGKMIVLYGPASMHDRGGTICFNIMDTNGTIFDERLVATESAQANISLRTGCFCNPGAGEAALDIKGNVLARLALARAKSYQDFLDVLDVPAVGAIRVSFGIASVAADVESFVAFVEETYQDRIATKKNLTPRARC
ncbi:hypothetical protein NQ176_g4397 [Zarea fungicola]|uniref:Uncharacterized protein n=1 Tax=Zarea fungicola TaxID=93591 RepID=A0ACC1NEJ4_9HYPO|nr:hypothetical protein NQ176_g4397 [Lecanicillium fungicola]